MQTQSRRGPWEPNELRTLRDLRARGQAPALAIVVTGSRMMRQKMEDIGCLSILTSSADQAQLDWSPMAGLDVLMMMAGAPASVLGDIATAIIACNPRRLCAWTPKQPAATGLKTVYVAPGAQKEFNA